ncbi:hypothetical protein THAOC_01380 [Thalassiosira oceanica]|uniref:3-oxoacyl-[acyl-carrier-protein] reductase n=1 Tax=Thalassiosira oceanica TaxID=159749 RepID=K0TQY1_THAOC|nr:hypothetical protein THAOC_01380 [Thalassiosira oceanica]|eukprot:EJK76837.1 hypothetical protein THAOC_01380 [Thalassiosira oceanica]
MDLQLEDKLCLVTGSTGGIGIEIARMLLQNKVRCSFSKHPHDACYLNISHDSQASVIINGRSQRSTSTATQRLRSEVSGAKIYVAIGDLSSAEGVNSFLLAVEKVEAQVGQPVSVLVNNLGVFHNEEFEHITDEKWQEYYQTNTMSGVRLSRHFLPKMLERNSFGRIIFISSEAALKPLPNMLAYGVSKTSQLSLSRGLSELTKGKKNITVNCVLPGPTMTDGLIDYMKGYASDHGFGDDINAAVADYFKIHEPTSLIQRFLDPKEVAYVTVMLCSPLAGGINGTAQHADGGIVRHIS